jgi:hypothetical protein
MQFLKNPLLGLLFETFQSEETNQNFPCILVQGLPLKAAAL